MASPASRHARLESVVAWCARKESAAPPATAEGTLPDWIVLGDRPVPLLEEFKVQAVATRIHAYVMALIDGRRSIRDMARMLVEQRLISAEDAEPAVRRFLVRMARIAVRVACELMRNAVAARSSAQVPARGLTPL